MSSWRPLPCRLCQAPLCAARPQMPRCHPSTRIALLLRCSQLLQDLPGRLQPLCQQSGLRGGLQRIKLQPVRRWQPRPSLRTVYCTLLPVGRPLQASLRQLALAAPLVLGLCNQASVLRTPACAGQTAWRQLECTCRIGSTIHMYIYWQHNIYCPDAVHKGKTELSFLPGCLAHWWLVAVAVAY